VLLFGYSAVHLFAGIARGTVLLFGPVLRVFNLTLRCVLGVAQFNYLPVLREVQSYSLVCIEGSVRLFTMYWEKQSSTLSRYCERHSVTLWSCIKRVQFDSPPFIGSSTVQLFAVIARGTVHIF